MSGDVVRNEWKCLATVADLKGLMYLFGSFHDACVREIHVETGHWVEDILAMQVDWRTTVHMLIQRQALNPSVIELRFEEVVALHVSPPPPNCEAIIFQAAFFVRDGVFYWAESGDWTPESFDQCATTWVTARHVSWRDASNWLGPQLRYRTTAE